MFIFATLKTNKIRYYEKKLNLCFHCYDRCLLSVTRLWHLKI